MTHLPKTSHDQSGFGLIEVLVALVILLVGLLGLAGIMVQSQRSEMESYQRVQALILLRDMAGRINANRNAAECYGGLTPASGAMANPASTSSFLGTSSTANTTTLATCTPTSGNTVTATQSAQVTTDMNDWQSLLLGAAETSGGNNAGAMIGARGCINYDGTNLLTALNGSSIPGTGLYTVSVAWQGLGDTFANTSLLCGQGWYGSETRRRVVSLTFRIGSIGNIN